MENQFSNFCAMGNMEDTKQKLLLLIKIIQDMLDFSKKPEYPVSGKFNVTRTQTEAKMYNLDISSVPGNYKMFLKPKSKTTRFNCKTRIWSNKNCLGAAQRLSRRATC